MPLVPLVEYTDAPQAVRAAYGDIMATRGTDRINNFWNDVTTVMGEGALDPLVQELVYLAVSVADSSEFCIHSHTAAARAKGMTDGMLGELLAVVGLPNETNRLANGYRTQVDERFLGTAGPDHGGRG
jgi:AhpD family alkylhydroperoxidase